MADFRVPGAPPPNVERDASDPSYYASANLDPKVRARIEQYQPHIDSASKKHRVPKALLESLIQQESRGNPNAVSPAGAAGLTQIMPGTARGLGVDPRVPEQAVEGAARYLAENKQKFGSWELAVAAYHAGPGNVAKAGGIPDTNDGIIDTRSYVGQVLGRATEAGIDEARVQAVAAAQHDLERRLNVAQDDTGTLPSPDEAARLRREAAAGGVPFGVAMLDPKAPVGETPLPWSHYSDNKPLADILLDPHKAVLVSDEADRLARLAKLDTDPLPSSTLGKLWQSGDLQIQSDLLWAKKGMSGGTLSAEDDSELQSINTRMGIMPEPEGRLGQIGQGIVQQGPRMLRMAAEGAAGALAGAGVGWLVGPVGAAAGAGAGASLAVGVDNGLQAYGNVYQELTEQVGVGHNVAHPAALIGGAIIAGLDTVSFGVLSKIPALSLLAKIPAVQKLTKNNIRPALRLALKDARFTKLLGELALDATVEGGTESLQEVVQILTDYAGAAVEGGEHKLPSAQEAADRTLVSGLVGGIVGAASGGVGTFARETALRVNVGEKSKVYIDNLYAATDALKSSDRAPDVVKEYVDRTAKGGPVQTVTLPVEQFVKLADGAVTDEQKAFFASPEISRKVKEAQASGARVSLTLGDFVAYVRPLDKSAVLKQEIGLNDAMSPREATELKPAIQKAKKEMAEIGKRKEQVANEPTSLITRDLEPKLLKAGLTPEAASLQADLLAGAIGTLSKRVGKDPWTVYQGAKIDIDRVVRGFERGNLPEGMEALDQKIAEEVFADLDAQVAPLKAKMAGLDPIDPEYKAASRELSSIVDARLRKEGVIKDPSLLDKAKRFFVEKLTLNQDVKRVAPGFYTTPDERYEISKNEAGEWSWNRAGKPPDDIFRTKADALAALKDFLVKHGEDPAVLNDLKSAQKNDGIRGQISFNPILRNHFQVTLTGQASLSTFLHESAHYLLELMRKLDGEEGGKSALSDDLRTLEAWAGVKPGEEWSVPALEKFARGMETYFGEGKAPSAKLVGAFATVKGWILHVYRLLNNLGAPLTDEVRSVMDRMLATQDEIDARRMELGYFPSDVVITKGGMTEAQQAAYRAQYERGAQQATARLEREAIASLRKEKTAEFKRINEQVEQELDTHPALALRAWFQTGGKRIDGGITIPELAGKKLDPEAVKALNPPPGVIPKLKEFLAAKGTPEEQMIDPSELAPYFGFTNASEMVNALGTTPARATLKAQMVKEEMTKLYPAYGPDRAWVERTALEALHENDAISTAIETEMATIYAKAKLPPTESPAQVARMAARQNVQEMTRAELAPSVYRDAETRAHRAQMKALAAEDFQTAAEETRKRLYARAMWLETTIAAQKMDAAEEYASRFTRESAQARLGLSDPQMGPIIRDAAIALVNGLGLTKQKVEHPFGALVQMLEQAGLPVLVPEGLRSGLKPWANLSYGEALSVKMALKNLSAIAGKLGEVTVAGKAETLDNLATSVEEGLAKINLLGRLDRKGEKRSNLRFIRQALLGPEHLILELDGGEVGPAHRLWFGSAEKGQFESERRHIMRRDDLAAIREKHRPEGWHKRMKQKYTFTEGDGHEYTGSEVFAMLLNYGTISNRLKLIEGMKRAVGREGWSERSVTAFIHRVFPDRESYLFAQKYLDYISSTSLWEDSAKVHEQIYGVRPEKVDALPIPLPDGSTIPGGYYPLIRDMGPPLKERELKGKTGIEAMDSHPLATMYAAHGFTEERTGAVYPLVLDPTALAAHLYEVDHFIANAQGVLDRHKFLNHPRVVAAIKHSMGLEAWEELRASNNFIASGGKRLTKELLATKNFFDRMLFHNAILTMGGNLLSGVNQVVTGVPATITQLGPRGVPAFAKALVEFAQSPFQMWKDIGVRSGEIAGMNFHFDKDLRISLARDMTGEPWAMIQSRIATTAMTPVVFGQKIVNVLTFRAAEILAEEQGFHGEEAVARANSAVRLSQSSSAEKDIAAVQRSDDLLHRTLMSLASYTVALNNLVMPKRLTARELGGTVARGFMLVMTSMMMKSLMDMLLPVLEEKDKKNRKGVEKWAEDTEIPGLLAAIESVMDIIGNVPLAGRTAQAVLSGRTPRYASWADTVTRSLEAAPKLLEEQGYTKKDVKVVTDTVGLVFGVPTRNILFAPGEAAYEVQQGHVDDGAWRYMQEIALVRAGQKGN